MQVKEGGLVTWLRKIDLMPIDRQTMHVGKTLLNQDIE